MKARLTAFTRITAALGQLWQWVTSFFRPQPLVPVTYAQRIAVGIAQGRVYLGEAYVRYRKPFPSYGTYVVSEPIYEELERLNTGLGVIGDSGGGKSSFVQGLLRQRVEGARQKTVILVIDYKSTGAEIARHLQFLARGHRRRGWKFYMFSTVGGEYTHSFNLITNLGRCATSESQFAESVCLALGVGNGPGHEYFFRRAKRAIIVAHRINPRARTCQEFLDELRNFQGKDAEHIEGLVDVLEDYALLPALNRTDDTGIDLRDIVQSGHAMLYFRLPHLRGIGRGVLRAIKDAVVRHNANLGTADRTQLVIFIDEYHRIAGDDLVREIQVLGRDVGASLTLAWQMMTQVAAVSESLVYELMAMPTVYFGSADGGYTNKFFRDASTQEHFRYDGNGELRSYMNHATLTSRSLEELIENKHQGRFLMRFPRSRRFPIHFWGERRHCMSPQLYESFRNSGFFLKDGELEGAHLNPPYECFPNEGQKARTEQPIPVPSDIRRALADAAQVTRKEQ